MKVAIGEPARFAPSAACHWHVSVAVAVVLAACGGHGLNGTDGAAAANASGGAGIVDVGGIMASGGSAQGGNDVPSGGQGGTAWTNTGWTGGSSSDRRSGSTGLTGGATGGVTSQGGSTSGAQDGGASDGETLVPPDASCDLTMLWDDVATKYLAGSPFPAPCYPASQVSSLGTMGSVVFDRYGHLVDDTGFGGTGTDKQLWLDALSTQSWPCVAGQTIPYVCGIGE